MCCLDLSVNPLRYPWMQVLSVIPLGDKNHSSFDRLLTQSHPTREKLGQGSNSDINHETISVSSLMERKTGAPRGQANNSRSQSRSVSSFPGTRSNICAGLPMYHSLLEPRLRDPSSRPFHSLLSGQATSSLSALVCPPRSTQTGPSEIQATLKSLQGFDAPVKTLSLKVHHHLASA